MLDLLKWHIPETLPLNLMNALLGLAVVLAAASIGWRVFRECRKADPEETEGQLFQDALRLAWVQRPRVCVPSRSSRTL